MRLIGRHYYYDYLDGKLFGGTPNIYVFFISWKWKHGARACLRHAPVFADLFYQLKPFGAIVGIEMNM